uniref:Cytochrome P450 2F2-like protein n=1 Tax=Callorhinchus milii TaxID=7868 RepID=V9KQY7_CALMI
MALSLGWTVDVPSLSSSILLAVLTLLIFTVLRRKKDRFPPGPPALPLLGNIWQISTSAPHKSLLKLSQVYGPVFTVWLGRQRAVVFAGYETVKDVLVTRGDEFNDRFLLPFMQRISRGYGVLASSGDRWKQLRRFTLTTLRDFGMGKRSLEERIQEEAQNLVTVIGDTQEKPFDPDYPLRCAVSNVICSIVFGDRFSYKDETFLMLMDLVAESVYLVNSPWGQIYNNFPTVFDALPGPHNKLFANSKKLQDFMSEMILRRKETFQKDHHRDYIDTFLAKMDEEGKQNPENEFNHKNLLMTVFNLFFAGTETTSTTLRWGLRFLQKYPRVQERVQDEIDRVIGRDRCPAMDDRAKMPYTNAVIHEVQRCIDLVPMNLPHMVSRDTEYRGYSIPKGTLVIPLLSSVLNAPTQWETPETFNPEHFLDANGNFRKREGFMAFSAGKRMCLGESLARMELFLFFTVMLQKFSFRPLETPEEVDVTPAVSGMLVLPRAYQCQALAR